MSIHKIIVFLYFIIGLAAFIYFGLNGWNYYTLSVEKRFFSEKHELLKPSGLVGHTIGIIGSLMMVIGVLSYMIRKRVRRFHTLGYLKHWLEFHIFMCSVGPIFVLYHTAFKFGGIISIGFWSMIIVVLSGVLGRVVYLQIPRSIKGEELSLAETEKILFEHFEKIGNEFIKNELRYLNTKNFNVAKVLTNRDSLIESMSLREILKRFMYERKQKKEKLKIIKIKLRELNCLSEERKRILKTINNYLNIQHKLNLYRTSQYLFNFWHLFHLPFAITMFVLMIAHIIIAVLFGAHWMFKGE